MNQIVSILIGFVIIILGCVSFWGITQIHIENAQGLQMAARWGMAILGIILVIVGVTTIANSKEMSEDQE